MRERLCPLLGAEAGYKNGKSQEPGWHRGCFPLSSGEMGSSNHWDHGMSDRRSGRLAGEPGGKFGFDVIVLSLKRALMLLASQVVGKKRGKVIGNTLFMFGVCCGSRQ
jgi:hypothetical protein